MLSAAMVSVLYYEIMKNKVGKISDSKFEYVSESSVNLSYNIRNMARNILPYVNVNGMEPNH